MKDMLLQNELRYPFVHRINPEGAPMDEIIAGWIKNSFVPDRFKKKYLYTGMGHCAGCAYPLASLDQLKAVCRFFLWAFSIDDLYEKSSLEKIQEIEEISLLALRHGVLTSDDPIYASLPEMRRQLIEIGSEKWLADRFCVSLKLYFEGLKEALVYRLTNVFPTVEEYLRIRINDVNVFPMVNLAEAITGTILPNWVISHPSLERLAVLTARILSFANDYFSARQEAGSNVMNLVLILNSHTGWTMEEAYKELLNIHDEDVQEFLMLTVTLPDFEEYNLAVEQYIDNLKYMISGYLYWTLQLTERYKMGGHPVDGAAKEKVTSI